LLGDELFDNLNDAFKSPDQFDRFGVFSLSSDPMSPPMWAHYSSNYHGYVVGFDTSHPYFKFKKATGVGIFEVLYETNLHSELMDLLDKPVNVLARKRTEWAYEKEWRHIRERSECDQSLDGGRVSLFRVPFEAVKCVIKSERADDKLNAQIADFSRLYGQGIEIGTIIHDWQTGKIKVDGIRALMTS
jgi:Protein of unknown function (DUF2971)